jgi:hypothetical protein
LDRRQRIRVAAAVGTALAVGLLLAVADRLASRPDRIRYEARKNALVSARDALLRYEHDNRRLPARLDDLVPLYLREDQLVDATAGDGRALYAYDPGERTISMASAFPVRGLVSRMYPPAEMVLPPPQSAPAAGRGGDRATSSGAAMEMVVPSGPDLPAPPEGAYVFEAEHYSDTNYGWEVHPDPAAAGGAYIHSKEGIANYSGQTMYGVSDFYNIGEKSEYTYLKYHFRLPKGGRYYICGRFWTTGSHCSNCIIVGANEGGPREGDPMEVGCHGGQMYNRTPFRWVWTVTSRGPVRLDAGDNYLHLFLWEDGVRLDQIALSPSYITGGQPYAANLAVNEGTSFRDRAPSPVDISFDYKSMVIAADARPEAAVAIRRIAPCEGDAALRVVLEDAGAGGADLDLGTATISLAELPELAFLPVDFSALEFEGLPRREFLLRATLTSGGKRIAECHVPLMHAFRWEVAGPGRYYHNDTPAPLDGDREKPGVPWEPLAVTKWDHFGVMDFGLQWGGNSLHAPELKTAYARTRVVVPESPGALAPDGSPAVTAAGGEYLLKIQSDDQMLLWIDGKLVYRHDREAPVTRSVKRLKLQLAPGEHRVRMRVNQGAFTEYGDGRWQASLRFRTVGDDLSDVCGR